MGRGIEGRGKVDTSHCTQSPVALVVPIRRKAVRPVVCTRFKEQPLYDKRVCMFGGRMRYAAWMLHLDHGMTLIACTHCRR